MRKSAELSYQGKPARGHYTFQRRTRAGAINLLLLLHAYQGRGIKYFLEDLFLERFEQKTY